MMLELVDQLLELTTSGLGLNLNRTKTGRRMVDELEKWSKNVMEGEKKGERPLIAM